jgi:hypothetical protein
VWCWQGGSGPSNPECDNECNRAAFDSLVSVDSEALNDVTRSPAGNAGGAGCGA